MKIMITKKTLLLLTLSAFSFIGMKAQLVTGVKLSSDTIILGVDSTEILKATVFPFDAADKTVHWTITNPSVIDTIAIMGDTGYTIKGKNVDSTRIIVETENGHFRATCFVKVIIPVDSVRLKDHSLNMILGHDTTLISKIFPSAPTNDEVIWSSSDSSVVDIMSVDKDSICTVKALNTGIATIFVTSIESGKHDSCIVTVNTLPIDSVVLSVDSIKNMPVGSKDTLIAYIYPLSGGTNDTVKWSSSNSSVVGIATEGYDTICVIKAKAMGEAIIYAVAYDGGKKDSCYVSVVNVPVDGISLNTDSLDLMLHADIALVATITPHNATNDSVKWISRDSSIVDIISIVSNINDTICKIKAIGSGQTTIVAETFDGGKKDSCVVTVIIPTDSVVIYPETIEHMEINSDTILIARVYPDSSTYKTKLNWVNLDSVLAEMVIVDDTICQIKALKAGVDTIYVETEDGERSRFCYVTIDPKPVDSVRIDKDESQSQWDSDTLLLNVNGSFELKTTVYPSYATNDTIEFSSSDPAIARIDSTSDAVYISALQDGTATIYATTIDGSRQKDSCIVKIKSVPATGIRLDKDTLYLYKDTVGTLIVSISPRDATDKSVQWRPDKSGTIEVISTDVDSVYKIKGLAVDTVLLHAYPGEIEVDDIAEIDIKDSCIVIVKEQLILVESDTASLGDIDDGLIKVSLKIPNNATVTGSFTLQLPKGFGLALKEGGRYKSKLADGFAESSKLDIARITEDNDSTYVFNITLRPTSSSNSSISMKEVLEIAYTIYDNTLENSKAVYDAKFVDVSFVVINSERNYEIKEEQIATEVKIKAYRDPTGNELVKEENIFAYLKDRRLYVNTAKAETVYVYLLNGSTVMAKEKTEGVAVFDMDIREKILIVRGSSGWAQKVVNQ
jgi:uncharacterized protein YjdB